MIGRLPVLAGRFLRGVWINRLGRLAGLWSMVVTAQIGGRPWRRHGGLATGRIRGNMWNGGWIRHPVVVTTTCARLLSTTCSNGTMRSSAPPDSIAAVAGPTVTPGQGSVQRAVAIDGGSVSERPGGCQRTRTRPACRRSSVTLIHRPHHRRPSRRSVRTERRVTSVV